MTVLAVLFLALDALLLGWLAVYFRRVVFGLWSIFFLAVAGGVVWFYRRYLRELSELNEAREGLKLELERLREALALTESSTEKDSTPDNHTA